VIHPESLIAGAALLGGWLAAWRVRGERPDTPRTVAFLGGLMAGAAALNGPLHDLAEHGSFSAHMAQHLLLVLVAPPLLLAGTPNWMMDRLLAVVLGWRGVARPARWLTRPVPALALFTATLIAWHLPALFTRALASQAWHAAEHAALVAAAALAWWPVLGPSRLVPPLHHGAQLLYLFVFGMPMTVVAALITGAEEVLYPGGVEGLADQRLGGVLMWVPAGLVPLAAFTLVFFRWAATEADEGDEGNECSP
jgi:putative membrane protein